jgi:Fe-S cluster assembly scaffold protein SufB
MENIKSQIQSIRPELPVTMIELPDGHSMNDIWLNYGADGILELLKNPIGETQNSLEIINDFKIRYKGKSGTFFVVGQLPMDLGNLRVSLQIIEEQSQKKSRLKIDLYDFVNVQNQCRELSEKQGFDANKLEADLIQLTDLLEQYRDSLFDAELNPITDKYSEKELTPPSS